MIGRRRPKSGAVENPDDPEAARRSALLWLSRRDHSSAELFGKLTVKGHSAEAARAAIAGLEAERLARRFGMISETGRTSPGRVIAKALKRDGAMQLPGGHP